MENKPKTMNKTNYDESQSDLFILEQIDVNDGLDLKKLDGRE